LEWHITLSKQKSQACFSGTIEHQVKKNIEKSCKSEHFLQWGGGQIWWLFPVFSCSFQMTKMIYPFKNKMHFDSMWLVIILKDRWKISNKTGEVWGQTIFLVVLKRREGISLFFIFSNKIKKPFSWKFPQKGIFQNLKRAKIKGSTCPSFCPFIEATTASYLLRKFLS